VLLACETFLLGCCYDFTVTNETGSTVMIKSRNSEYVQ
jgi:hypothetical protein